VSSPPEGVIIVVVSLEQAVAASLASRQLADLGARVVKVARMRVVTSLETMTIRWRGRPPIDLRAHLHSLRRPVGVASAH